MLEATLMRSTRGMDEASNVMTFGAWAIVNMLASAVNLACDKPSFAPSASQGCVDPLASVFEAATTFADIMDKPWPITGYAHGHLLHARHIAFREFVDILEAHGVSGAPDAFDFYQVRLVANVLRALNTTREGTRT